MWTEPVRPEYPGVLTHVTPFAPSTALPLMPGKEAGTRTVGLPHGGRPFTCFLSHPRGWTQPHSENPQTWHFTHPSANSSWLPQSGQVPMKASPPDIASNCICAPPCDTTGTDFGEA